MREAVARLSEAGEGELEITERSRGHSDLDRRALYVGKSEEERLSTLALVLRESLPEARLLSASFEGFDSFEEGLTIRYRTSIPALGLVVGDRMILAPSLFGASAENPFTAEHRHAPIHFPHAERIVDRIVFELPRGYEPGPLPEGEILREGPFLLVTSYQLEGGKLDFTRRFQIDVPICPVESYPKVRAFFERAQRVEREAVTFRRVPAS